MGSMKVDGRSIRNSEKGSVISILESGRTADAAGQIARDARSHADWLTEGAKQLIPPGPIACREGCSFCCHLQVVTTIPEVLEIARTIRSWAPAEGATIRSRIEAHRRLMSRLDDEARWQVRAACPLLLDGRCSVYPIRPMSCRGWNSLDVRSCEDDYHNPASRVLATIYGPQYEINAFVQEGMAAGLEAAGLQHERVELVAALEIALDVPNAEARWLAGEPIFDRAVVRCSEPTRRSGICLARPTETGRDEGYRIGT